MLGRYVLIAVNNPKKYPKEPLGTTARSSHIKGQMSAEDEAKINALFGGLQQKTIKDTPKTENPPKTAKNKATGP